MTHALRAAYRTAISAAQNLFSVKPTAVVWSVHPAAIDGNDVLLSLVQSHSPGVASCYQPCYEVAYCRRAQQVDTCHSVITASFLVYLLVVNVTVWGIFCFRDCYILSTTVKWWCFLALQACMDEPTVCHDGVTVSARTVLYDKTPHCFCCHCLQSLGASDSALMLTMCALQMFVLLLLLLSPEISHSLLILTHSSCCCCCCWRRRDRLSTPVICR